MFRSIRKNPLHRAACSPFSSHSALIIGLLLALGQAHEARADFIPAVDGDFSFYEQVQIDEYDGTGHVITKTGGSSLSLPETVTDSGSVSGGGYTVSASGSAEISVGGDSPAAKASGQFRDSPAGINVSAIGTATVSYGIELIKLHPDAPDDPWVPLHFSGTLGTGGFSWLEITRRGTGSTLFDQVNSEDHPITIDSTLSISLNETIGVETGVRTGDGLVDASAPVFAMDPGFLVPFGTNPDGTQRFERAVDLYTVTYPAAIGFAGNFATVTPLTDGCLPDPSILGPSGTQSVTGGETITCRALDPSGFRSYGTGVQNPLGTLSDLDIIITPDAIVRTDEEGTQTIGLLGSNNTITNDQATILATGDYADTIAMAWGTDNSVDNRGAIGATGLESHAITIEGENASVVSTGAISSSGDDSAAVFLDGLNANLRNQVGGVITTDGEYSSAVVLEGDDALIENLGEIQTSGGYSSGLVIEGGNGRMTNRGSIGTQGRLSAGMVLFGNNSRTLENIGTITTIGNDAFGMLALGQSHDLENLDAEAGTGIRNRIRTTGARAHGIALGLQDTPPGFPVPGLLQAASGSIDNSGLVMTEGDDADAIHALAHAVSVTNRGDLSTKGRGAHGISVVGDNAVIQHGDGSRPSTIETTGSDAKGIFVLGDHAKVTIDGESLLAGISTLGEDADAVLVSGDDAEVMNTGELIVRGNESYAINGFGDDGRFENLGSITAGRSGGASGNSGMNIAGGDRNRVYNNKSIFVESHNSYGIFVQGDDAVVANGDTQHASALIGVVGNNAAALRVESNAPNVVNDGELAAEGDKVFGISAVTGIGSTFQVTSGNQISVAGSGAIGMSIATSVLWGAGTAGGPAPTCAVTSDGKSKFVNCGNIEILNSTGGTGMLAIDVVDTSIENQKHIVGSGAALRGIEVIADPLSGAADNYVGNVDLIELSGDDSIGISVSGNANFILHGTGTIAIPNVSLADPLQYIDPFGTALFLPGTFENVASDFDQATSGSPNPIIPRGNIAVTGPNAIGIAVDGDNNRIAISVNEDPNAGAGQIGLSTTVTATGTNAIGVKLTGNNNLLVNGGEIVATGVGVLGSNGSESVDNKNLISGGVQLKGGDDVLIIEDRSEIIGVADGGLDHDVLVISTPKDLDKPAFPAYEIDGSKFVNFEQLEKVGAGNARLRGTLVVDHAWILQGDLQLKEVYLQTADSTVTIAPDGSVTGTGTLAGRVEINGGTLSPGGDGGVLTIDGDLALNGGMLAFGAGNPSDLDELIVTGDMELSSGSVDVLLGFTPDPDEVLELIVLGGALNIDAGFSGVFGRAAAGSGVAIGTPFSVDLGGQIFQTEVTSAVPIPASAWLYTSALLLLGGCRSRRLANL